MRSVRVLFALSALAGSLAQAADLQVLTAGAFAPVVLSVQPVYERASGNRLQMQVDTAGGLQARVVRGDRFDVVISSPVSLQAMASAGRLADEPVHPLARVGMGVAVRRGAPLPDVSTVDAFRHTLVQARSVAYVDPASGGTSGVYLDGLFQQWGIAPQIRAKAVLVRGGQAATRVADGSAELAMQQISELLSVPDVVLAGPLPPEIQRYTVYTGAVSAQTAQSAVAHDLLTALRGPVGLDMLRKLGMLSP